MIGELYAAHDGDISCWNALLFDLAERGLATLVGSYSQKKTRRQNLPEYTDVYLGRRVEGHTLKSVKWLPLWTLFEQLFICTEHLYEHMY